MIMNKFKSIYWHQGLFLKPHHFQYLQAQQQEEYIKLRENIEPYFWGVSKVNIDLKELLNRKIVIEELEMVFMDGTSISLPKNSVISSRSFDTVFNETDDDIQVYIGLKSFNENVPNVTELDSLDDLENVNTRYISNSEPISVNNLYQEDESADVQFMDYCLKIFFDDEVKNLNAYQIIPLTKIQKRSEQIVLSSTYTSPLLGIKADANFLEVIKSIQRDLSSHLLQLHEYKLPSSIVLQEANYLKYVMALQALSPYAPRLNHMLKLPNLHPMKFYELFLELVAVLSTFSNRVNAFGKLENGNTLIRDYDHFNLYECFSEVKLLIKELLDVIIIGPEYVLPFTKNETSFTLDCPVSIFQAKYRYFLLLKTPTDQESMTKAFSKFAKIAASSEIDTIVERSLLGLGLEPYAMAIQGLPQREESVTFELQIDDDRWNAIQQTQNITIEFDEALDDVSMELVVLKN